MSQAEFGKLLGISPTSVSRHIKAGHITERSLVYSKGGKPKILVDYAIQDMEKKPANSRVIHTRGGTVLGGNLVEPERRTKAAIDKTTAEQIASSLFPEIDAHGKTTVNGQSQLTVDGIELDFSRDPASLAEAKVREAIAKAVKLELDNQEKRKTLVDKAAQDRQFAGFAVNLKNDLGAVADRLQAIVAVETSPTACRNLIHKEIENVLIKHSKKWPK